MVYQPREDSYLLKRAVEQEAFGRCLDVGTGTGILARSALKKCRKVVAADIDQQAVNRLRKRIHSKRFSCLRSDLFSCIGTENRKPRYDTIIFNPPYLPRDSRVKDRNVEGGKKGYELLERFFSQASQYLAPKGIILTVFSSLTNQRKVEEIMRKNLFDFQEITSQRLFFERLYVYKVTKSRVLKSLERRGVRDIRYFARGKRGVVLKGRWKNQQVAVKTKRRESRAVGRIKNEAKWLKILNQHRIGPKLYFSGQNYLVYRFVKGNYVVEHLQNTSKKGALQTIHRLFAQLYQLDQLGVDKEEMHRPIRHIIIQKRPVLIDFERAHRTNKPKNITQFCQFLISHNISRILHRKGLRFNRREVIRAAREYKRSYSQKKLKELLQCFG